MARFAMRAPWLPGQHPQPVANGRSRKFRSIMRPVFPIHAGKDDPSDDKFPNLALQARPRRFDSRGFSPFALYLFLSSNFLRLALPSFGDPFRKARIDFRI